jgi:hypothetical protein
LCTIRGALSEFGAVCLQGLWNGHLDLRGRTSKHPYQLKYQRWRLISTPECIHCLAPPGVFKRYDIITTTAQDRPPCSADSTSAGSLSSAGFSWQGSEIRDWTPHRPSEWSSFCLSTVQAATPPAKLKGRGQPQKLAGSLLPLEIATGGEATTGAGIVESRLSRLLHTYWSRLPTPCAAGPCPAQPLLGWYPMLRVCDEVEGHGIRVLSAERPNDGLKH